MEILGLLGMYFDAAVVEVEKNLLLFRFAMAILYWTTVSVTIFLYFNLKLKTVLQAQCLPFMVSTKNLIFEKSQFFNHFVVL